MGKRAASGAAPSGLRRGLPALLALLALASALAPASASADNLPTLADEQASEVGVTTAKMTGTVNPNGEAGAGPTTWRLQFTPTTEEAWTTAAETTIEAPASEAANPVAVEAILGFGGELQPGTTYEFRLQAENGAGQAETAQPYPTFTMDAATEPTLIAEAATDVAYTTATLHGQIDPEGGNVNPIGGPLPIYWQLEYREAGVFAEPGEGWSYGGSGEPIEAAAAESTEPIEVEVELGNGTLQPAHSYETRVVAYYLNFSREAQSAPGPLFETKEVSKPSVEVDPVSSVTDASAHFSGQINPNAPEAAPVGDPNVEAAFTTSWYFECVPPGPPCGSPSGEPLPADNDAAEVSAEVSGLEPSTEYTLALIATNAGGTEEATTTFTTEAVKPVIAMPAGAGLTETTAHLHAFVNPKNSTLTDCTFE